MKKYKMMALTGILLSSAILGANTSVVQAASANTNPAKAINVDKSSLNNIIQVINDLLGSSSTANKVNAQTKFSDLVAGNTYKVAPIFGEQSASTFATALQSELNVVDGSGQLVPMTVVHSDDHGFATEVRYTLDGVTKNINVDYNFGLPTISDSNKVMNFKSNDASTNVNAVATSGVTINSDNQTDANGNSNKTSYTASPKTVDLTKSKSNVIFTPSDSYKTGISSTRDINVYQEPDWAKVSAAVKIQSGDDVTKDNQIYTNESGQSYSVAMSNYKATDTKTTGTVDYTLTAIDSKGNVVNDSLDNKTPISFSKTGQSVAVNSDTTNPNYTIVFTDGGNVVGTAIGTGSSIPSRNSRSCC